MGEKKGGRRSNRETRWWDENGGMRMVECEWDENGKRIRRQFKERNAQGNVSEQY